jgi:hypothetical protein
MHLAAPAESPWRCVRLALPSLAGAVSGRLLISGWLHLDRPGNASRRRPGPRPRWHGPSWAAETRRAASRHRDGETAAAAVADRCCWATAARMACRVVALASGQAAISARLRWQPRQCCRAGSRVQRPVQGEAGLAGSVIARPSPAPAGRRRPMRQSAMPKSIGANYSRHRFRHDNT